MSLDLKQIVLYVYVRLKTHPALTEVRTRRGGENRDGLAGRVTTPISPIGGEPMRTRGLRRLGVFVVAALALAACGSTGHGTTTAAPYTPAHKVTTLKTGVLTLALTSTPLYS